MILVRELRYFTVQTFQLQAKKHLCDSIRKATGQATLDNTDVAGKQRAWRIVHTGIA